MRALAIVYNNRTLCLPAFSLLALRETTYPAVRACCVSCFSESSFLPASRLHTGKHRRNPLQPATFSCYLPSSTLLGRGISGTSCVGQARNTSVCTYPGAWQICRSRSVRPPRSVKHAPRLLTATTRLSRSHSGGATTGPYRFEGATNYETEIGNLSQVAFCSPVFFSPAAPAKTNNHRC